MQNMKVCTFCVQLILVVNADVSWSDSLLNYYSCTLFSNEDNHHNQFKTNLEKNTKLKR